jgi:hypothetical protein
MRRALAVVAAACLLAGPTVLAFYSGGYYTGPRLIAAIVAWALVAALAVAGPAPLPRTRAGFLAVGGLVAIAVWSAVSLAWAPQGGPAIDDVERLALYAGGLLAAIGVMRSPAALRTVEPALAAGATIVIGYGLSGRLLPGLVHLAHSQSADGRLEQPITYWNGEGALAAVGLVLCARIAGDRSRPAGWRVLAMAAVVPLGAGVYLSFSRGAIAVAILGLLTLVAAVPTRAQLRAAVLAVAAAVAAALASGPFPGVASLTGQHRSRDGAIVLVLLVALCAAAALGQWWADRRPDRPLASARRLGPVTAAIVVLVTAGLVVGGLAERPSRAELSAGANATRLASVSSNRYEYWRVALKAFEQHPVEGLGAGGFRVYWLQERSITETVRDTHSLEFEMAAELGLVGLLALAAMVVGVGMAARRALQDHPAAAAGLAAATLAWFLHASIDWDWELPAVSGPAVVMAGALIALSERSARRPASTPAQEAEPLPVSAAAR